MNWRRGLLVVAAAFPLMAISQVPGPIEVGPSWGSVGSDGRSASLFTTISNHGVLADRLAGIDCPGWGRVATEGLDPATQGDRPQDKGVLVPQGGRAVLAPGGAHVTLADAPRPIGNGTLVACTLHFIRSGERLVVFTIGAPGPAVVEP